MTVLADKRIGFVGAGNMGSALIGGLVKSYLVQPESILASDIDPERRGSITRQFGVRSTADNREVVDFADVVVLAVKANVVAKALEEVGGDIRKEQIVISICAGVSSTFIQERLPNHPPVIRVMPNTPALVGVGMSALAGCAIAKPEDVAVAKAILGAVGEVLELEEKHLDAVTAISGSGPAYFFYLMEKMEAAGLAEGLPAGVTRTLVRQTAFGAAKLCIELNESPRKLRQSVTSPGGTTEAAVYVLDSKNMGQFLVQAVREAAKRSRELGK